MIITHCHVGTRSSITAEQDSAGIVSLEITGAAGDSLRVSCRPDVARGIARMLVGAADGEQLKTVQVERLLTIGAIGGEQQEGIDA